MSTRKDEIKTPGSSLQKKKVSEAKTSTRRREESTDRRNVKKTEVLVKTTKKPTSLANTKDKTADINQGTYRKSVPKTEKPLKTTTISNEKTAPNRTSKVSKTTKPKVPVTPPSNRVLKTQFFPSKNMYSNALKMEDSSHKVVADTSSDVKKVAKTKTSSTKVPREITRSKVSTKRPTDRKDRSKISSKVVAQKVERSSDEVMESIEYEDMSSDVSSLSERPRTATLRKGSIVNENIVGPDVPKAMIPRTIKEVVRVEAPSPKPEKSDEYNYEDDFESYESDFEEYFSSSSTDVNNISGEETSSISSSSEHLPQPRELKSAEKRISSAGTDEERKLDSGNFDMPDFKHKQILDNIKESVEKENANLKKIQETQRHNPASLSDEGFEEQKSLQFINFLDAKKKYEHRKSMEIKRKRGEEILNMIRLDTYSFTLFDLPPVPYETFIKNYGRSNTIQTAVQTGEDNANEEVQTENIIVESSWTQFPVCFSKIEPESPHYWCIYKSDYLGVGGDHITEENSTKPSFNESYLNKFLISAGNLILNLQADSNMENNQNIHKNSRDIPFSDGYVLFNTNKNILKGRTVKCLSFCCDNSNKIMTVHLRKELEPDGYGSVVCIWNMSDSEDPETFFISYGYITCCSFGLNSSNFIYAGLDDGTISVWDSKKTMYDEGSSLKRVPLYTTEIGSGHTNKIVSLQPFVSYTEKVAGFQSNQTNEICSLDEEGDIILWSVILKHMAAKTNLSSSNNWIDIILVKNTRISLKSLYQDLVDLQCTDFVVSTTNSNYIFVSTNYGFIIHHLIKGGRSHVKKFFPEYQSVANCLETCPFSTNYFLTGFSDGTINLYSRLVERSLMVLSDKEGNLEDTSIQIVQWSRNKPFVIYTKDISNTIHIWDLNESDIYPTYSIPFKMNITCMKLSPLIKDDNSRKSYMMIGTEDGNLYLHILNNDHGPQSDQIYNEHVNTFLNYSNRL